MTVFLSKKNFAKGLLNAGISSGATSLTLQTGQGTLFPAVGTFRAVLWDIASFTNPFDDVNREIVSAVFSAGNTFTITRAQESTTASAFLAGAGFAHVLTAGQMTEIEAAINAIVSGEANTASNVGVGGVGVFKQKTGVNLEFRNINSASARVSVALDTPNNEIDVDVAQSSDTVSGIVELATIAETDTGTDATRAVTPDGLAGSIFGTKGFTISLFQSDVSVATGDGKTAFTVPASVNGMNLVNVVASVHTQGVTGATDVQVRRRRAGVNADMLSTKVTLGAEFFASDEVIDLANDDVLTGDQIYVDIDAVHTTPPLGLSVALEFRLP